ncbi:prophage tail fiber N-terminal domain-containing protein [Serratia fonticola]|uniref:phage tail fiber protein n=1 Tax=Serratia fonticola TaxID=47917 RepID=UPI001378D55C|nr:prophage tail fiber N-terminal domain-containing protein [Serratia fonticola]NCG52943.1 hypothetical protein [Serratia fonticola]
MESKNMAVISGVLKGPMGDALEGVVIELRALRTSATVITQERSSSVTNASGRYSLTVEPGDYSVFISAFGRTPENRGSISVKVNSATGTLNDFLLIPGETDLNPAIVETVDGMRAAAAASAAAAKTSADNAAAAMTNALSKVVTAEQKVVGQVTFSKQTGLTTTSTPAFNPSSQGFWSGWNRVNTGASELINHKGDFGTGGGFNFYETDGSEIKRKAALSPNGFWTITGGLSSVGDQVMDANATTANVLIRFRNQVGIENSAIYAQTDTGVINIRWGGTAYTMQCRGDAFVSVPCGHVLATGIPTPESVIGKIETIGTAPFHFRGADAANFNLPNNYSIGTSNGFSVLPTAATGLASGVEQGKPVFFVNARSGTAHVLNNMYVGAKAVIKVGDFGFGGTAAVTYSDMTNTGQNMFYNTPANTPGAPSNIASAGIMGGYDGGSRWQLAWRQGDLVNALSTRVRVSAGSWSQWSTLWHSTNTTVDANGFLKKASPIVKLFGDGQCELNDESQGVTTERVSEGVYRISGTLGFNADAEWGGMDGGIEIPTDRNKLPLVWVDYEVDETGDLLIKTFHRVNSTAPKFAQNVKVGYKEGQPIDIPAGRWIDLRVEMPCGDEPEYVPEPEQPDVTGLEDGEEVAPGETEQGEEPKE